MRSKLKYVFLLTFLTSCGGETEPERMLREYQQKGARAMNFELDDLGFEIVSVEKYRDITASDSMGILKQRLAELWSSNHSQELADTITFEFVRASLDTVIEAWTQIKERNDKLMMAAMNAGSSVYYDAKDSWREALDEQVKWQKELVKVAILEKAFIPLAEKPDSVLSVAYRANYRIKNPLLGNAVQTFNKLFYTDATGTAFVKEEDLN
jgi:hypothetical protein